MRNFFKKIYSYLRFHRKCNMDYGAMILGNTVFGGMNKICRNAYVKNTFLGFESYIGADSYIVDTTIGKFSSIGDSVKIINSTHPLEPFVSTHPVFYSKNRLGSFVNDNLFEECIRIGSCSVQIGNDVWIGSNVLIKGGVSIGNGAVIGMGSVVVKDVPPFSIVGGVPAKVIRYRFTEEQRLALAEYDWWDRDIAWLEEHSALFSNIDSFMSHLVTKKEDS